MTGSDLTHADVVLDRVGSVTGGIRALLEELASAVEPQLDGWTGSARAEYLEAKRAWELAAGRMPECLDRARDAFGEIARSSCGGGVKTE